MNHPVPGGGHHSNPSVVGNDGECFLNARLVGRELVPAEIALPETWDLSLSHRAPFRILLQLQEIYGIFSCIWWQFYMSQTIEKTIIHRIRGTGGWWAFSPRDFLDLGGRPTVDSVLHRLEKRGEIRRVIRGVYDYPRFSKLLDQHLSPDIDQVARALARKFRWRIQPSGATALNFIGLSTQVPARAVYLSDGPDRAYQVGNSALVFEHTALKESGVKLKESGLIVQALKSLGQKRITPEIIAKIRA
jgi:hypothetical protein